MDIRKYSRRNKEINNIFIEIASIIDSRNGIAKSKEGIAEPGDLFFHITHYPHKTIRDEVSGMGWRTPIWKRIKPFLGLEMDDFDAWHVGIYYVGRKRKYHQRINNWIIHSTSREGVHFQHITPGNFSNENSETRGRMEILRFEGIKKEQRNIIIDFAKSKVGSEFDRSRWSYQMLPYVLGLPNLSHNQNQFSCQQLAIAAYTAAGIHFRHPYKAFPIFNIGRYLGHPLGHPKDRVDPRYPYLMDHHIYRDPRFVLKAAVYQDPNTDEIILQTGNLKKYSWNESLREKYIKMKYLDP